MKTTFLAKFAAAALLAGLAFAAAAQSLDKPVLLVASPERTDFYEGAVMIVVPKGTGHVGFMVNRETNTTVASAFPDEPDMLKVHDPIYLGGPTQAQSMYAAVRRDPGEGSRNLFGNVFVTTSGKTVERVIRERPGEARFFAGYTAWSAGELSQEIAQGAWLVTEPNESALFGSQPDTLWADLVERIRNSL